MTTDTPIARFYDALRRGEPDAMRACFAEDARVWHCFDGIEQTIDEAMPSWEALIRNSQARHNEDVRVQALPDGFVQQHMFVMTTPDGKRIAWPVCLVVRTQGDRIARIDEYIDRAGSFPVGDGPVSTPGFPT